jgi:DNA-binding CsgD family transcriptional regulator
VTARYLVGREDELGAIVRLLSAPDRLPGVAVLPGEAGIGKTSLWLAGVDAAAERGYRILSSRPSEAETRFSFAGLTDLLGSAGDVVAGLPPVQRRALEVALLLGEPEIHVDDRAVANAFLEALRRLSHDAPVCLAVDDVQWLDAASLAVLRFAIARLEGVPVAALLAVRGDVPEWLRRAVPEDRRLTVHLTGLSLGATHELLRARLDATFARPTLIRLWETSRGNPFFALELAAALGRRSGTLAPGEDLPIPSSLDELLAARIDGLGAAALEVARAVAALADPTVTVLEAALGVGFDRALAEALDARILELDREHVRFTHPLLGSAVWARQTPGRRRSLHARLADVVPSAEERARHLALATDVPDGKVADVLEHAAGTAHLGGAPVAAADLAEQALRLTPLSCLDDALRRTLIAADMHTRAGDTDRAIALLERARAAAVPGDERATVLARLAGVRHTPVSIALYHEALEEARDDALRATIHIRLATAMRWDEGVGRAVEHAELAVRAASRVTDATVRCRALAVHGITQFYAGRGVATATMEEAISLERSSTGWPLDDGPTVQFGFQLFWSADIERGRGVFQELERAAKAQNNPTAESVALWFMGFLAWRAGDWEEAERYIADALGLLTQLGDLMPPDEFPAAVIAAHRGRIGDARAIAQGAIARAEGEGIRIAESGHGWVLGFVELSLGAANAALVHLRRSYEIRNAFMLEPAQRLELGDLLEALIAVGELDEAEQILATWQERAGALDRAWALAILARCRGLLLAARSDLEGAFASFEHALAEHARCTDPFHHGRTLLALGRTQRRAKRRAAARTTLEEAVAAFQRLGAPLWSEQARAELARIGGRSPSHGDLTAAESRIAGLVAEGHTNREVAAALFLTEHSVEAALTRIYRKLGVRSRAELTRLLAAKS